jgi:hypothetical protein
MFINIDCKSGGMIPVERLQKSNSPIRLKEMEKLNLCYILLRKNQCYDSGIEGEFYNMAR